jgi:predicted transcriptional regulator
MTKTSTLEQLVGCLLQVVGRSVIPENRVRGLIGKGKKNLRAFNMCDGRNTQKEIAKKLKIDQGQLSKTFTRWVESGIAFRLGEDKESRLLHIYPVTKTEALKAK